LTVGAGQLGQQVTTQGSTVTGDIRLAAGCGWYRGGVALRREDLSAEQLKRQQALDRSWHEAEQGLADPELRAYLEASLRRLDEDPSAPLLTREQFLAQTK